MRLVYLGTPAVAVPPLQALVAAGHEIVLVVSAGDKRRGRGSKLVPSPVKAAAVDLGLAVTDRIDDVLDVEADLGVVVAYGRLIKPPLLAHLRMINIHFSLLPRWRGAAPVERAILAGDAETGVCLMAVEEGLDTGGVYRRATVPIADDATLEGLRGELIELGSSLLVDALADGLDGLGQPEPQVGEPVYAAKLDPAEFKLEFDRPAAELDRTIRVGRAWATFRDKRLRVWEAGLVDRADLAPGAFDGVVVGTGDGALELVVVQPEGKGRMAAGDWRNGAQPSPSDRLA
ncbi:MAG: methionyl-tRNA formyltransferase [Acidimicrobiales bacterium]